MSGSFAREVLVGLGYAGAVGGGLLFLVLVLRRWTVRMGAAWNHQLILMALVGTVALPFVGPGLPGSEPQWVEASSFASYSYDATGKFPDQSLSTSRPRSQVSRVDPEEPSRDLWTFLFMGWLGIAVFLLLRTWIRVGVVFRMRAEGRSVEDHGWTRELARIREELGVRVPVSLLTHPGVSTPMVWGPPRSFLFLPERMVSDPPLREEMRYTLLHELAHLQRRDSMSKLLADILCSVFWFNPFVWLAKRHLENLQEMAADSQVLAAGVRPSDYSRYLLDLFRESRSRMHLSGVSAALGRSGIAPRLGSILEVGGTHRTPGRFQTLFLALGWGGLIVLVSVLSPQGGAVPSFGDSSEIEIRSELEEKAIHDALNPVFVNTMAERYIAGAAISMVRDGKVIYERGFGRAEVFEPREVIPDQTVFRIGSVSKVVTGVAVMQLVDRGLLALDADVNRYLEAFKVDENYPEPVTVEHLLTHTAGFDQFGDGRHARTADSVRPLGDFLAENLVRIRPPGILSCYDTYAITLAGYLVEKRSGKPFEDYLIENIFLPLDMKRSSINVDPKLREDVAVGYGFRGRWEEQAWEHMNTNPASTVNSTVADMANFARMLLDGGVFKGRRVLSEKSVDAMMRTHFTNHPDQPGYGLTFFEDTNHGVPAFSHGGSMTGYGCFLYLVPQDRFGLFVAYNQESGVLADRVIDAAVGLAYPDRPRERMKRPRSSKEIDLDRFIGQYAGNGYNHTAPERGGWRPRPFPIERGRGGVLLHSGRRCIPVGDLAFQRDDGLLMTFLAGDDGAVTHLVIRQSVYEKLD